MGAVLLVLLTLGCWTPQQAPPSPPPILLISLDTLRADRLGCYGSSSGLTPNLDRFAEHALVFDTAYSQANATNLSHASLFSSRYPSEIGMVAPSFQPSEDIPLLAEVFRTYGYQTGAAVGGGHLSAGFGLQRGFDSYEVPREMGVLFHTVPKALEWLEHREPSAPWFLFLHGYDTHARYLKPSPFGLALAQPEHGGPARRVVQESNGSSYALDGRYYPLEHVSELMDLRNGQVWSDKARRTLRQRAEDRGLAWEPLDEDDEAFIRDVYDGAVAYMDSWFGLLLIDLEERGILDEAVVVVLSDHGESLGEDGLFSHNMVLSEATLRVPLIIRPPGGLEQGRHVPGRVALLDVLPTLLDLAGIPAPASIHGRSLAPFLVGNDGPERDRVFSEGYLRSVSALGDEGRLVFSGIIANDPMLPALIETATLTGPSFQGSDAGHERERAALRQAMLDWRAELHPTNRLAPPTDPQLLDAMQERGYWRAQ